MDVFQEIYDGKQGDVDVTVDTREIGFPEIGASELDQLKEVVLDFLKIEEIKGEDRSAWVFQEIDYDAINEYCVKSTQKESSEEGTNDQSQNCSRCCALRNATKPLTIKLKEDHLKIALTCLRHVNNKLFQQRAWLLDASESYDEGNQSGESNQAIDSKISKTDHLDDDNDVSKLNVFNGSSEPSSSSATEDGQEVSSEPDTMPDASLDEEDIVKNYDSNQNVKSTDEGIPRGTTVSTTPQIVLATR